MTYLLDTDCCIGLLRQRPGMVARLSQVPPGECGVSSVTVYELLCRIARAQNPEQERRKVERFLSVITQLPFDRAVAEVAADVRIQLEKKGTPIGPYDILIAGHAMASNAILVTNNVAEFQRVDGLKLERWP